MTIASPYWVYLFLLVLCGLFCAHKIITLHHETEPQRLARRHSKHLLISGFISFPLMVLAAYSQRDVAYIWQGLILVTLMAIGCFMIVTSERMRRHKKFTSGEFELIILFGEALYIALILATPAIINIVD